MTINNKQRLLTTLQKIITDLSRNLDYIEIG